MAHGALTRIQALEEDRVLDHDVWVQRLQQHEQVMTTHHDMWWLHRGAGNQNGEGTLWRSSC